MDMEKRRRMMLATDKKPFWIFKEGEGLLDGYLKGGTTITLSNSFISFRGGTWSDPLSGESGTYSYGGVLSANQFMSGTVYINSVGYDFSRYKKLCIEADGNGCVIGYCTSLNNYYMQSDLSKKDVGYPDIISNSQSLSNYRSLYEIDISNRAEGNGYWITFASPQGTNPIGHIYNIWLE